MRRGRGRDQSEESERERNAARALTPSRCASSPNRRSLRSSQPSISSASPVPRETIARVGGVWRALRARRHPALYYARVMHYSSMASSDDRPTCSYLRACVSRLVFPSRIGKTGSVTVTKPHHRRARARARDRRPIQRALYIARPRPRLA